MKQIFLFICCCCSLMAYAQPTGQDYIVGRVYEGYFIDNDGERTDGFIRWDDKISIQGQIVYWEDQNNRKTKKKLKPEDISEFYVAGRTYRSIESKLGPLKSKSFMLLEVDGHISVYVSYSRNDETQQIEDEMVIKKEGEDALGKAKLTFKFAKTMSAYVSDYSELAKKIKNKEKGYRLLSLLDIIDEYNAWYEKNNK